MCKGQLKSCPENIFSNLILGFEINILLKIWFPLLMINDAFRAKILFSNCRWRLKIFLDICTFLQFNIVIFWTLAITKLYTQNIA